MRAEPSRARARYEEVGPVRADTIEIVGLSVHVFYDAEITPTTRSHSPIPRGHLDTLRSHGRQLNALPERRVDETDGIELLLGADFDAFGRDVRQRANGAISASAPFRVPERTTTT